MIQGPQTVLGGGVSLAYAVSIQSGDVVAWSLDKGTITSGQGTGSIQLTAPALTSGSLSDTFNVTVKITRGSTVITNALPVMVVLQISGPPDVSQKNLVFNGGFELGITGFECNKYLRYHTNPTMAFDGPIIDTTTFSGGKQSLRLSNQHSEYTQFYGREMVLKPNTTYTYSASFKGSQSGLVIHPGLMAVGSGVWRGQGKDFTVTNAWKRYSYTFTTGSNVAGDANYESPYHALCIRMDNSENAPAGYVWIDDLQIVEGNSAAAYAPSADVEIGLSADKDVYIEGDGSAAIDVTLSNTSANAVHGSLALRLEEEDGAASRVVDSFLVSLQPGERKVVSYSLPLSRFGALQLVPEASLDASSTSLPVWFAYVGKYTPLASLNPDTTFTVGINGGLEYPDGPSDSVRACNASPESMLNLFANVMGGHLIRHWDNGSAFTWDAVQPTSAQDQSFERSDYIVATLAKYGISSLAVLESWPNWIGGSASLTTGQTAWLNYVNLVTQRYKGKVRYWEIMNEPNLWLPSTSTDARTQTTERATLYLSYLKAGANAIRAADSSNRVVGFCVNFGWNGMDFLHDGIADGSANDGLNFADVVSFHPYSCRSLGAYPTADQSIADMEKLASDAGHPNPVLWASECYYLAENQESGDEEVVRAKDVSRRFLTDLGEGVKQSICIFGDALWRKTINPHFDSNVGISRWMPSGNFVAYNALARLFEGATPAKPSNAALGSKLAWSDTSLCYIYQRNGQSLAAAWVYRNGPDQVITLPDGLASTQVLDVFGNRITTGGTFTLGQTPVYLVPPAGTHVDAFISALASAPQPSLSFNPLASAGQGQSVTLKAKVTPWPGHSISSVKFQADGKDIGQGVYNATNGDWELSYAPTIPLGGVLITALATDDAAHVNTGSRTLPVKTLGTHGNGGQPWQVPSSGVVRIRMENYDEGGEGAAYHDYEGWVGDSPVRDVSAAIVPDLFPSSAGVVLGSTNAGEWVRFTMNVLTTGTYTLRIHYSNGYPDDQSKQGAIAAIRWKGTIVAQNVVLPATPDQDTFQDVVLSNITLSAGTDVLQIECGNWGTMWAWIEVGH